MSSRSISLVTLLLLAACGGSVAPIEDRQQRTEEATPAPQPANGPAAGRPLCDARPACDPGHTQLASDRECPDNGAPCYARETCGEKIWCTAPAEACAGLPSCPDGFEPVKSCIPDSNCTVVTVCGESIICQEK